MTATCTLGEALVFTLARTVRDGTLAFHGFGSPLVQLALHVAKRTHAPNLALVAGATYGVNPDPVFLTATTNDWTLDRGAECALSIGELFDLAAAGRLDQMFLSGLQIDAFGNANVTVLGDPARPKLKLPGGGGGCNLSCDVGRVTLWTAAHRSPPAKDGRRLYRLVERCDFVTSLGHRDAAGRPRAELGHRGAGPTELVTELGVFDYDADGHARLVARFPDTTLEEIGESTAFELRVAERLEVVPMPSEAVVGLIRRLNPMRVHDRELRPAERGRRFGLATQDAP